MPGFLLLRFCAVLRKNNAYIFFDKNMFQYYLVNLFIPYKGLQQ
jgi:hypothetical protein